MIGLDLMWRRGLGCRMALGDCWEWMFGGRVEKLGDWAGERTPCDGRPEELIAGNMGTDA